MEFQNTIIYWFWPLLIAVGIVSYCIGCFVGGVWGATKGVRSVTNRMMKAGISKDDLNRAYKELSKRHS